MRRVVIVMMIGREQICSILLQVGGLRYLLKSGALLPKRRGSPFMFVRGMPTTSEILVMKIAGGLEKLRKLKGVVGSSQSG